MGSVPLVQTRLIAGPSATITISNMRKSSSLLRPVNNIGHNMCRLDDDLRIAATIPHHPDPSASSVYSRILQSCINKGDETPGRLVHGFLISSGIQLNITLSNKLIIFYSKFGDMAGAQKVFDKMPERNIVSWTALLSGYSQHGFFRDALSVFSKMHHANVKANQFTYASALSSCTKLVCLRSGKQIQGRVLKSRFWRNLFVQSALVDLHSKCGDMEDASYVFEMMPERDLVCWNSMIGGFAAQGLVNKSFKMFQSMMSEGVSPDGFTLGNLLSACNGGCFPLKVVQVHPIMIQLGFESHNLLSGLLIDAYAKCGNMNSALQVFTKLPMKNLLSYTALINGYAREGEGDTDALKLFIEIHRSSLTMDDFLFCSILNVCANGTFLSFGEQSHALILKYQPGYDAATGNALINMYAKSGELAKAKHAFDVMEVKNVISWSTLIDGYAKHGNGHKAISLYKMMEWEGLKPNEVTFLSLLFACSHTGSTKDGWECFSSMVSRYNITPRQKHYSCMIDICARGGHVEEAFSLIQKMNIEPDASLWCSILGACKTYGNVLLGEAAARHLFCLDPKSSATFVVLGNLYAAVGSWDTAYSTRILMAQKSMKKSPGYSYVLSVKEKTEFLPCQMS